MIFGDPHIYYDLTVNTDVFEGLGGRKEGRPWGIETEILKKRGFR